jgi:hypothetical protein
MSYLSLLEQERNMLPGTQLRAAYRALAGRHGDKVQGSLVKYLLNNQPFRFNEWYELIAFCKNATYQDLAWEALSESFSLEELQRRLAWKLQDMELSWEAKILPRDIQDQNGEYLVKEIVTARALVTEGAEMSHCVGRYVEDCHSGRMVVLSTIAAGDRYTVSFLMDEKGVYSLSQFKGRFNQKPPAEHYNTVLRLVSASSKKRLVIPNMDVKEGDDFLY